MVRLHFVRTRRDQKPCSNYIPPHGESSASIGESILGMLFEMSKLLLESVEARRTKSWSSAVGARTPRGSTVSAACSLVGMLFSLL